MNPVLLYILKLSVGLSVVFLFYQLVLRKLTFYNWNRWYLLIYTLLCFFIPLIDLSPMLEEQQWTGTRMIQWVPVLPVSGNSSFNWERLMIMIIAAGAFIMLLRLVIQFLSFRRLLKKAELISDGAVSIYQVNENIIPFSFGNAVFINQGLHTKEELEEIIRHEFIHVKQKHSTDIIWGEIVCLLNWYNPFVWLLRKAIRQNLEFIADDKVLQQGIGKKEYQYMLLKVIGNNQFSIAPKFNFSSLKKRIAMMNKNKSAKANLLRFLFLLPLVAVILVSFRKQIGDTLSPGKNRSAAVQPTDTVPAVTTLNSKGYYIDIIGVGSHCTVVVKDKDKKEVKRMLLNDWTANEKKYEGVYGEILPPPPAAPAGDGSQTMHPSLQTVNREGDKVVIKLKNDKEETYDFSDEAQRKNFEKQYGVLPEPPAPPMAPPAEPPAPPAAPSAVPTLAQWIRAGNDNVKTFSITNNKVMVGLKKGGIESYDLNDAKQKELFEKKYGKVSVPKPPPPAPPAAQPFSDLMSKPEFMLTPAEKTERTKRLNMKPGQDGC